MKTQRGWSHLKTVIKRVAVRLINTWRDSTPGRGNNKNSVRMGVSLEYSKNNKKGSAAGQSKQGEGK